MKRPQVDVGFAYAAHALARRAEEVHVRLAAKGVECASRFEIAGRSGRMSSPGGRASALADSVTRGMARTEPALRRSAIAAPVDHARGMATPEPALRPWQGAIDEPADHGAGMGPTEPALPIWRGTIASREPSHTSTSEPPRTSGLVVIPGPLTRGRR